MDTPCIAALLEPFLVLPLSDAQLDQTSMYIDLLLRWNSRVNLTAIRDPEEIVTRHFGESFFLARHVFPRTNCCDPARTGVPDAPGFGTSARSSQANAERSRKTPIRGIGSSGATGTPPTTAQWPLPTVVDLGSGAGFPGLPVKIWAPEIHLTLIESNHKKAAFLREVARALTLTDVNVIPERAESLAGRLKADVVTFRAVEHFDRTLSLAARLLAPEGRLAILVGSSQLPSGRPLSPSENQPPHPPSSSRRSLRGSESQDSSSKPSSQGSSFQGSSIPPLQWREYYIPKSRKRVLAVGSPSVS